jgi:HD-GYP domain-containing protein (c-di-GMP phosphodiesterase class II)
MGARHVELEDIEAAAQLRDVGNMAIPDEILHSAGRMGEDEWRFIQFHTLVGERLLGAGFGMHAVALLVRSSHERWDGGGYPDGLAGEEIPLGSRIIFVCSAFQDMTSDRAHRAALSAEQALTELGRCAATQFDPRVVEAFGVEFVASEEAAKPVPQTVADSGRPS